jgi:sphingolipid delta-4 desaturase
MNRNDPHWVRREALLAEHPEVKQLYGRDPWTAAYIGLLLAGMAVQSYLASFSWYSALALGVISGPFFNAGILVAIHELSHNLVSGRITTDRLLGILVNIPMLFPISEIFRQHHNAHHLNLGDARDDVDAPLNWEVGFVGNSAWKKAVWLGLNMLFLPLRSLYKVEVRWNRFVVLNWVVCLGFTAAVALTSLRVLLFLGLSLFLSQGAHPANARQLQEHFWAGEEDQALNTAGGAMFTFSYYGISNLFYLNVGYHNEHHDFARVPWRNLPKLREIGGDKYYPDVKAYGSRGVGDVWNFIFNDKVTLANFYSVERGLQRVKEFNESHPTEQVASEPIPVPKISDKAEEKVSDAVLRAKITAPVQRNVKVRLPKQ